MDGLHEHAFVLVAVALGVAVEEVVDVLVDLLLLAVLAEEPAQHALSAHPKHLGGHARLSCALALANAGVPTFALGIQVLPHTCPRVHLHRLADDQTVLDQFPGLSKDVSAVQHEILNELERA